MSTLRGLLDIRPEERRNTFAGFGALLAITSGHTLLETARDALFLSKLSAAQLPWMYLVLAVLALGLSRMRRADSKPAIVAMLGIGSALTAGFFLLGRTVGWAPWVLYALYMWSGLFASWVTVQLWTLLGRAHTMTQAKRLYGFIGAGAVLGGVVGAGGARLALAFLPSRAMLLAASFVFVLSIIPVLAFRTVEPTEPTAQGVAGSTSTSMTTGANLLRHHPFARRILGIYFAATVAVTLADFLFKARIADTFHDTHALAAWLSSFYAVTNALALVAQIFIGPWIFRTVGVQRALFFFPILVLGASGGILFTGGALAAAVLLKGLDGTLRYSVHRTSMELLLVPVPDGTRERIKPIIELVGGRGGQAVASLGILVLVALGAANTMTVAAVVVLLTALWLANVITIRGHYLDVFRDTLRAGGLSGKVDLPDLDLGALETLFAGLNSSRDVEVLASLELLAEQHRERLIPALILYHPSREVVLRALDLFARRGRADFVSIADRLNGHPDREVAAAALRARTAVEPDRKLLETRLDDPCAQVAVTALVALIARGWISDDEADRRLTEALAARSWSTAAEIARSIRDLGSDGEKVETREVRIRFDEVLIRLAREAPTFKDDTCAAAPDPDGAPINIAMSSLEIPVDARVRLEVARAMMVRKSPEYLPVLVGMLNRHELRATARAAIALIPGAVDFVDHVMHQHDFARDVRVHLPRTLILFEPQLAARRLIAHLISERDGAVRYKVIRALVKLRRANPGLFLEEDILRRAAETTLDHSEDLRRWRAGLARATGIPSEVVAGDPLNAAHHLLVDLVRDKESHAIQRLFMLFDLLYGEDFEGIERGLRSKKPKTRASSLELVENLVRPPLRTRVLQLVGDAEPAAAPTYEEVLGDMLLSGGSTMRTLAEYRAVELGIDPYTITGGQRPSHPPSFEAIGRRLVDRARDLLTEPRSSRAPA